MIFRIPLSFSYSDSCFPQNAWIEKQIDQQTGDCGATQDPYGDHFGRAGAGSRNRCPGVDRESTLGKTRAFQDFNLGM